MAVEFERRRFSFDEYFKLVEAGILREHDRVELIDGEILLMAPIGLDHASVVARMNRSLVSRLGERAIVMPQSTQRLSDFNAPEPDFAIAAPRDDFYRSAYAKPSDMFAFVEVAQSSLAYDRGRKLRLYARHGIQEYWIADLADWSVEVLREPREETYASRRIARGEESLAFAAVADVTFTVAELLGPKGSAEA
jgi:Uma2 family endonuclease